MLAVTASSSQGGGVVAPEKMALARKIAGDIAGGLPSEFNTKEVQKQFPIIYEESMNTVLLMELIRYNRLIAVIRSSLDTLEKTLEGLLMMNSETEDVLSSLINNQVPQLWRSRAYPSLMNLIAWVEDLKRRIAMFNDWIENGQPKVFWISGFFFTQSFLTGIKQNFARMVHHPIDKVDFEYEVLAEYGKTERSTSTGCFVHGLLLEGAGWDVPKAMLVESKPKELVVEMPIVLFKPYKTDEGTETTRKNDKLRRASTFDRGSLSEMCYQYQ